MKDRLSPLRTVVHHVRYLPADLVYAPQLCGDKCSLPTPLDLLPPAHLVRKVFARHIRCASALRAMSSKQYFIILVNDLGGNLLRRDLQNMQSALISFLRIRAFIQANHMGLNPSWLEASPQTAARRLLRALCRPALDKTSRLAIVRLNKNGDRTLLAARAALRISRCGETPHLHRKNPDQDRSPPKQFPVVPEPLQPPTESISEPRHRQINNSIVHKRRDP